MICSTRFTSFKFTITHLHVVFVFIYILFLCYTGSPLIPVQGLKGSPCINISYYCRVQPSNESKTFIFFSSPSK